MEVAHTVLRIANTALLRRVARLANTRLRPRRPIAMRIDGHTVRAATLDRIAALWLRKWTGAERYETRLWCDLIKPGMVVADVGANLGVYTLLAARATGPGGVVHSFEPDEDNHALLAQNVEANGYGNVVLHRSAVADHVGSIRLYRRPEHSGDHRIYSAESDEGPSVQVSVTTLDEVFRQSPRLDLVKLDIQGAEARALEGMRTVLGRNPNLSLITELWPEGLTNAGTEPRQFLEALRGLGFQIHRIDDKHQRLQSLDDKDLMALCRKTRYTNLLATHPDA